MINRNNRRGVVLLVVLGLLAMFAMVAVAFVALGRQARRGAITIERIDEFSDSPREMLDQAAKQVLRGSGVGPGILPANGPPESFHGIGANSLLEDMYGIPLANAQLSSVPPLPACGGQLLSINLSNVGATDELPRLGGCVMTFYTGPAAGSSTRLVGRNSDGSFLALPFDREVAPGIPVIPQTGDRFVINGRPFSGTGFGYNAASGDLTAPSPTVGGPLALLPWDVENRKRLDGANEDYDAPDYNNPLLAAQFQDASGQLITIPSLHRPALYNYWQSSMSPQIERCITGRPNYTDHPDFAINNPNYNPLVGPWDVDNDGDGLPDSVWVDLGLPVRSAKDGRLYKPLFAILCLDMDGRLNLNAHGCYSQIVHDATAEVSASEQPIGGAAFAGPSPTANIGRGLGYGPAEINLMPACGTTYQQLLFGGPGSTGPNDGRYGEFGVVAAPGPGFSTIDDPRSQNKTYHFYRGNYWAVFGGAPGFRSTFGSPPDIDGDGAIGLDQAGRPLFLSMGNEAVVDDPYEMDLCNRRTYGLTSPAPVDNAFSTAELELILRPFDRDAYSLPRRLRELAGAALIPNRRIITTESWDVPVPGGPVPITDLLTSKGIAPAQLADYLPAEILSGLRMDVNRPFGNGRDDDDDNIVDENGETEQFGQFSGPSSNWSGDFNHDPYGRNTIDGLAARQEYARHLYILLMTLSDLDTLDQMLGGNREATAQYLAQWAINVVDFRDADAIMTPFNYDPDPLSGWNPPGDVAHKVWGCERPELLMTETLAWHNRATEDLKDYGWADVENAPDEEEDPESEADADDGDGKTDLDQRFRPQGFLGIELFNPWTEREVPPAEFYGTGGGQSGVQLNKLSPGGSPVWRMIICEADEGGDEYRDPDDPDVSKRPAIERSIYFITPPAGDNDGQQYNPSETSIDPIEPGRYAVIGSGETGANGGTTYIGFKTGEIEGDADTRQIDLDGNDANVVKNNSDSQPDAGSIHSPVRVIIDTPRRLSVTEPIEGYETPDGSDYDPDTGQYDPPIDIPQDETENADLWDLISKNQTKTGFRVVHLQRLANPQAKYDAVENPYRTIDSMPIDLTTFNGASTAKESGDAGDAGNDNVTFHSRQRGEKAASIDATANNPWKQEPLQKVAGGGGAGAKLIDHYFDAPLKHSLGYLNEPFGAPSSGAGSKGDPAQPFPWLNFNNRPFISQLELLLVPAVRSSKLLACSNSGKRGYYGFIDSSAAMLSAYNPTAINLLPYPHLLNFFDSSMKQAAAGDKSPELHRIFEYLRVPSPFVGTTMHNNPAGFTNPSDAHPFHPPFNRISTYREPGRINLNTVFDPRVMQGLINYRPELDTPAFWSEFVQSRRGYGDIGNNTIYAPNPALPTFFAAPFRTAVGGSLVPIETMKPLREIDATVMRSAPSTANNPRPLFHRKITAPYANTDRNPFFHYQGLQRLGNLVTTRSNVYATWITVGYFEVSPWGAIDEGHPDGMQLGRELGLDSGDVRRHRAFYMFDRSIPVGFLRGQDLNVEKAIIAKHFIE